MSYDKKYLIWALSYAIVGMSLGIYMGASGNHIQHPTHAHILLVGFVVSLSYGIIHKLWLSDFPAVSLARAQFIAHHTGAITMFIALFMLFAQIVPPQHLEPVLAIAAITVLSAAVMMLVLVLKSLRVIGTLPTQPGRNHAFR